MNNAAYETVLEAEKLGFEMKVDIISDRIIVLSPDGDVDAAVQRRLRHAVKEHEADIRRILLHPPLFAEEKQVKQLRRDDQDWFVIARISQMFHAEGSGGYSEAGIICPYCNIDREKPCSYVHFEKPQYISGNDNYEMRGLSPLTVGRKIDVRGDVIILSFYCEEGGHKWNLILGEHKGAILCDIILTDDGSTSSTKFDSPIEQAFWDEWGGNNNFYELTPQHPIGKYFVDFAHIPTKTAIELDGFASHSSTDDIAKDRKRQRYIEKQGWHVIRFGGKEIHGDVKACVSEAWTWIDDKVSEAIYS